jgi:hypothetical protein
MSITIYKESGTCAICGKPATWRVQPGGARKIGVLHACDEHLMDSVTKAKADARQTARRMRNDGLSR